MREPEGRWGPAWEQRNVLQSKAKVGDFPALASEERCLGLFCFATSARAGRWDPSLDPVLRH